MDGIYYKVIIPMVSSPIAGFVLGFVLMGLLFILIRPMCRALANLLFGKLQLASSTYMAWSHGFADGQKTMGVMALALFAATSAKQLDHLPHWLQFLHTPKFEIATWVKWSCGLAMAAGTYIGGWRIISTMGKKLVLLKPVNGFAAETTAAPFSLSLANLACPCQPLIASPPPSWASALPNVSALSTGLSSSESSGLGHDYSSGRNHRLYYRQTSWLDRHALTHFLRHFFMSSVFMGDMKTLELESNTVRTAVREHYGKVATRERGCGCAPTCCSTDETPTNDPAELSQALGYSAHDTSTAPEGANLGLGCGNPLAIASLKPGQTVLDLGSGAGFDAFLAANAVGSTGRVIGVDMTPEMLTKARKNQTKGDYRNVEFRLSEIENLPVVDKSIDVIISNCVINLSPEKTRVFREAFRVLKPGGRLAISDIVALHPLPEAVRADLALHAGCVSGASAVSDIERALLDAGFQNVRIVSKNQSGEFIKDWFPGMGIEDYITSATIEAIKP